MISFLVSNTINYKCLSIKKNKAFLNNEMLYLKEKDDFFLGTFFILLNYSKVHFSNSSVVD